MQELELLQQFIMIGSTERGSLDSKAHWYYNMQVLRIKVFFVLLLYSNKILNYINFSGKSAEFFPTKFMCGQFIKLAFIHLHKYTVHL